MPGYCVQGTVGHKILSGQRKLEMEGRQIVSFIFNEDCFREAFWDFGWQLDPIYIYTHTHIYGNMLHVTWEIPEKHFSQSGTRLFCHRSGSSVSPMVFVRGVLITLISKPCLSGSVDTVSHWRELKLILSILKYWCVLANVWKELCSENAVWLWVTGSFSKYRSISPLLPSNFLFTWISQSKGREHGKLGWRDQVFPIQVFYVLL